ncbi:MAG: class I SAM-dependent methyltransferase [Paludibacteraceae bacterium]|nr:class I SAM-dependent methyltransferase [Paludibacteraceae bacterium]
MGLYKKCTKYIRKKLGLLKDVEKIENPIDANTMETFDSWFKNKNFVKNYNEKKRLDSFREVISIWENKDVFSNVGSLLDFGCGTGQMVLQINQKFPDIKLSACDFSPESVKITKQLVDSCNCFVDDIFDIKTQEKYDLVLCSEVLEHLLHPNQALKNLSGLLKENGKLIITVPNGRVDTFIGHINFFSPESFKVFLEDNLPGFGIETGLFNQNRNNWAIVYAQK